MSDINSDCLDSRQHRVRNQSCSASSTMSSASSSSSSALSNLNQTYLIDILVAFPNGFQITKKLDSRKAVYDILIELSATAKLIPTNYTLKLFAKENENEKLSDIYKTLEYTPNQTIGQLNPSKISLIPKTATLKHQQINFLSSTSETGIENNSNLNSNPKSNSLPNTNLKTPFELTTRVSVNLPFNQKTVVRVKPDIKLEDLFELICKEACLDKARYELCLNQTSICMSHSLDLYNTNQVSLVLKSNKLNSKSTNSIFTQNKTRTQKKNLNKSNNDTNNLTKIKSKSEIDLSVLNSDTNPIENQEKNINKKSFKSSTTNLSKTNQSSNHNSMFSFFTRKKNSAKSKSKLVITDDNVSKKSSTLNKTDDSCSIKSITSNQTETGQYLTTRFKKRQAPAPPVIPQPSATSTLKNEQSETSIKIRSKSEINECRNLLNDLDKNEIQKLINLTKKKKKPAPLPPQFSTENPEPQKVITDLSPKSNHSFENMLQKEECLNQENENKKIVDISITASSATPPSYPSPSISESSSSNFSKNESESSKPDSIITESIITEKIESKLDDSLLITNSNCVKSFFGAVIDHKMFSQDDLSEMDLTRPTNSPSSNFTSPNYIVQSLSNQTTKIVINKNFISETYDFNNNNSKIEEQKLKLDTRIPDVLVESNEMSLSIEKNLEQEEKPSIFEPDIEIDEPKRVEFKPSKKTAIIAIRPELETAKIITISMEDSSQKQDKNSKKPSLPILLKSPMSPPPQFPAIGENEINELHPNYTVVRSGDIIEKNGIYYSTDGTIRGYSGIVKRLANSKALNEVFLKQQELEQQHEKEYQKEVLKRQEEEKSKEIKLKESLQTTKRTNLGQIVANEKKNSPNTNSQTVYKVAQFRKPQNECKNIQQTLEDELNKKLENRREKINSQIQNLEIDTNPKSFEPSSNSNSIKSSSSSCTSPSNDSSSSPISPQSVFSNIKLKTNHQNPKMNSTSFVMSAKVRSDKILNQDQIIQNRSCLLSELKSMVPLVDPNESFVSTTTTTTSSTGSTSTLTQTSTISLIAPVTPVPPAPILTTFCPHLKPSNKPTVAPKNFNHDTIQNINKKNQILNARDDLLESIKGFSITKLRKVKRDSD